ncbi:zinc metalloproteinase-disintegrin-like jararhagin [Paramormyrops kingsleyae]|uniref:zinc metalloproteinase-disintegrin-like jararhagin n=1 Tax=Paramormyrops kingsleyae TaxID=1676925 RepID=UPI003B97A879
MRLCSLDITLFLVIVSVGSFVTSERRLSHVKDYTVVRPQKLAIRAKRNLSSEKEYPDKLRYALSIEGEDYIFNLEKNRFLLGKDYTETYYLDNGTEVTVLPNDEDHCYYHGDVQDIKDSAVSVGLCSGMRGFVRAKQTVYFIEPLANFTEGDHAIYKEEHLRRKRSSCGHYNNTYYDHGPRVSGMFKPSVWKSNSLFNGEQFVEMFLVADNAEYRKCDGKMEKVKARMLEVVNHVDKLYRPLNIHVVLVGLEVWSHMDKIYVSTNPDTTLTNFLQWRQNSLINKRKHDNAQLVTGIDFDGDTVGLANKFAMCEYGSGAVNQDHHVNSIGVASTVAHEMGHNLGLSHDTSDCSCGTSSGNRNCIMADRVGSIFPETFSSCSKTELSQFLQQYNPRCLLNNPGPVICGNGYLEPGEECDCGTPQDCNNACCNATTCRLTKGSQCASGGCCENCQLKRSGSLCRKSANDCDLEEYCTGTSAECPKNVFKMNGIPCNFNQGYCYNGQCPTLLQHCKRLWGSDAQVGSDLCFEENTAGSYYAYCKNTKDRYLSCAKEDVKCGTIFCTSRNNPITQKRLNLDLNGISCHVALPETESSDIGMVPTGAKCGDNKVCYNNACQDIKVYGNKNCAAKCSDNGVCNHEGQCHCDPGWAPPYCNVKFSELTQGSALAVGVSVTLGILIPLMLVIGGLMWYKKTNKVEFLTKKKVPSASSLTNPLFHKGIVNGSSRDRIHQISQPIFVESSVTQACSPLVVTVASSHSPPKPQVKPPPPARPLPPLNVNPVRKPPVPPVKPTGSTTPQKHHQL